MTRTLNNVIALFQVGKPHLIFGHICMVSPHPSQRKSKKITSKIHAFSNISLIFRYILGKKKLKELKVVSKEMNWKEKRTATRGIFFGGTFIIV